VIAGALAWLLQAASNDVPPRPEWERLPSAAAFTKFYPEGAQRQGLEGLGFVSCTVTARGLLESCTVTREEPPGAGFGEAALRLATLFKMRPHREHGKAVPGGTVVLPIRFRLPAPPVPGYVTNVRWLSIPGPQDMARGYPAKAFAAGVDGNATIECRVEPKGTLKDCFVASEQPTGYGMGEAALRLAPIFRMRPVPEASSPEGVSVRVPIRWQLTR
jgi:TonB family protein